MGQRVVSKGYLIIDAVALIDFCRSDPAILMLISTYLGPLHIARPVLGEVRQIDDNKCATLGITVVEPNLEQIAMAASVRGALSFEDRICLILAKENGWTCITNDRRLRNECLATDVEVLWGLETLASLVECSALTRVAAKRVAVKIHETNPFITLEILERFYAKIGLTGS